ncbi:replication A protein [Serratia ureilytica]|nr:replication A protein [Serratia ureilytica]MBF8245981.1 replication A protein [Serratia ureilytica]
MLAGMTLKDITPDLWELKALARGTTVIYGTKKFAYPFTGDWPGFPDFT